ncbi:MAG: aspartate/glutamate racemase family protein [bacterium]|nr:aspartate/glutamate racemase family protein [bacterium]
MLGIIRVLSTTDPDVLDRHGKILKERYGYETLSACIPDQPNGIYDDASEAEAVPKIVALARELAEKGATAIFISCASDPGLAEVRQAVRVPVVGAGSAVAAVALNFGERVGVLGIRDQPPRPVARILGDRLVACVRPAGVTTTRHLLEPDGQQRALAAARDLVAAGVDTVALACTGLVTIGMAPILQRELGIPVVDPVLAGGLMIRYVLE